jgi:NADH-quinone oxidoreductase subunit G
VSGGKPGWETALDAAANRLGAAGAKTAVIVGGGSSNEEGYLAQRIVRQALGSPHVASTDPLPAGPLSALSAPELSASIADIDDAESVLLIGADPLHAMPILDLRLRKAVRHKGVRLTIASERPTALDGGAEETVRYAPGEAAKFLKALLGQLEPRPASDPGTPGREAEEVPGSDSAPGVDLIAGELRPGKTVILWGERIGRGPEGADALELLLECAQRLGASSEGAGLIGIPDGANARGLREVGCLAGAGPGFASAESGMSLDEIKGALAGGELDALILVNADPIRDLPDGPGWANALNQARTVIAVSSFDDASTKAADIVFPAEAYAEKEGTVTHPDGRLQRLRPAVPRPDEVRPMWQVLAELAAQLGHETGIDSAPEALAAIAGDVAFYAGVTHEEIGGTGVRWQERSAAQGFAPAQLAASSEQLAAATAPDASGGLRLGTYRDLWAGEIPERNVALRFLAPAQRVELAPSDGERLGLGNGDEVEVRSNGTSLRARVALRERMKPGAAFLIEGTGEANANVFNGAQVVEITKLGAPE